MADRIKPLSFRQAQNCETARESKCVCRCGGRLHGAARGGREQLELRGFYERLADEDPHRIPSAKERREFGELRRRRQSYLNARARYPSAWTKADEINLARMEKDLARLERLVLGGQGPRATAHAGAAN